MHSTNPTLASPLPADPTNFAFHNPQSIGQIWSELASITVSAFNPQLIARLRTFIAQTPCFELENHLQMLGSIVVRHVTLCLSDTDPLSSSQPRKQSQPSLSRSEMRTKRRSYRDIAYHAVRINRIVPQSQPLQVESTSSSITNIPRRLSIQKAASLLDVAKKRPSSTVRPCEHTPSPTKENNNIIFNQTPNPSPPQQPTNNPSIALREETLNSCSQSRAHAFPRAGVATFIESASMRNVTTPKSRQKVVAQPQNLTEYTNRFKSDSKTAAPISRLVQMRKQRAEKKRHNPNN
ncbi:unnamed protein product [Agarophyton chilense]